MSSSPKTPVPFIHDHGLFELLCASGQERDFFLDLRQSRFGADGTPQTPTKQPESRRSTTKTATSETTPGWHLVKDRATVLRAPSLRRLCLTIEGGIGKTTALRQAQFLWHQTPGNLAVFIEAKDLPADVNHFLAKQPRDHGLPLLVERLRDELDKALATGQVREMPASLNDQSLRRLLETALRHDRLMLLVDAFDQNSFADDGEARHRVRQLTKLLDRHPRLRCVIAGRPYALQHLGGLGNTQGNDHLLAHRDPPWRFFQVPEFNDSQARFFLDHGEPESRYDALRLIEADLLQVPRFLERLRRLPWNDLRKLRTASDVYWESLRPLIETGIQDQPGDWTLERLVRLLALLAMEMYRQGYRVAVPAAQRQRFLKEIIRARGEHLDAHELPNTLDDLTAQVQKLWKLNCLVDQAVIDRRDPGDLRWNDQTLQDFFAAVWLTRHAGPREGQGDAALDDVSWFTTGPRLHLEADEQTHLWHPVWRFAAGMPCIDRLSSADCREVICSPQKYVNLMERMLTGGDGTTVIRSTEMIYRCWPSLLALAGQLVVPTDRPWFEREVSEATTRLQQEIWQRVKLNPNWDPATAAPSAQVPLTGSGDSQVRLAAWRVLARFLSEYPRIVFAAADSPAREVALDFESWFQPIPKKKGQSLWFPMSDEGSWSERRGENLGARLDAPFQLAQYPTTNAVYQLFEPRHVSRFPGYLEYTLVIGEEDKRPHPQCPVTHVTWFDSWCACTWLHSRLPSEYEWEYACRAAPAAKPQMFWFGEEAAATAQHLWCSTTRTEPRVDVVGGAFPRRRQPNPWTLYDVHGNVWEWTASWFFDHAESGRVDGSRAGSRVLRGGSFSSNPDNCRASIRDLWLPSDIDVNDGFRAARAGSPR
jgi:hypothetical protein